MLHILQPTISSFTLLLQDFLLEHDWFLWSLPALGLLLDSPVPGVVFLETMEVQYFLKFKRSWPERVLYLKNIRFRYFFSLSMYL